MKKSSKLKWIVKGQTMESKNWLKEAKKYKKPRCQNLRKVSIDATVVGKNQQDETPWFYNKDRQGGSTYQPQRLRVWSKRQKRCSQ